MNQMNNNENILDIEKLYNIAKRLKESRLERISSKAVLKKSPSDAMQRRYSEAKLDYFKALTDFDLFVRDYIRINSKEGLQKINEEELRNFIHLRLNDAFDEYFKNGEVK